MKLKQPISSPNSKHIFEVAERIAFIREIEA